MSIISVEIIKTIAEREMQKRAKEKQSQRGARGAKAIAKAWELNDFLVYLS